MIQALGAGLFIFLTGLAIGVDGRGLANAHCAVVVCAQVARDEFVSVLVALAPGLVPAGSSAGRIRDKTEIVINTLLDSKIRCAPHAKLA